MNKSLNEDISKSHERVLKITQQTNTFVKKPRNICVDLKNILAPQYNAADSI